MGLDEMPSALPEVPLADDDPLALESLNFVRREGFAVHPVAKWDAAVKPAHSAAIDHQPVL